MNPDAPALVARARGLRRRLPSVVELTELATLDSPAALLAALTKRELLPPAAPRRDPAEALELGFRLRAAELFGILERWRGRGRDALLLVGAEEERRSVRALFRGAVAGAAPELRLAGLIPTLELPLSRLDALARVVDPLGVAAGLAALGWSEAAALAVASSTTRPDLAEIERIVRARFGRRLREAARSADAELRRELALAIDLDNVAAATALAGSGTAALEGDFLAGGRELPRPVLTRAATSASPGAALALLASRLGDAAIARALHASVASPARLGERLVAARLTRARAQARVSPLGVAPPLELALALRVEGMAIARLSWGLALDAPADVRRGVAA